MHTIIAPWRDPIGDWYVKLHNGKDFGVFHGHYKDIAFYLANQRGVTHLEFYKIERKDFPDIKTDDVVEITFPETELKPRVVRDEMNTSLSPEGIKVTLGNLGCLKLSKPRTEAEILNATRTLALEKIRGVLSEEELKALGLN